MKQAIHFHEYRNLKYHFMYAILKETELNFGHKAHNGDVIIKGR